MEGANSGRAGGGSPRWIGHFVTTQVFIGFCIDLPAPQDDVPPLLKIDASSGARNRHLRYKQGNKQSYQRLIKRWISVLKSIDRDSRTVPSSLYWTSEMDSRMSQHQCGTCCFGEDRDTSVLDPNCRAHEVDNLYVVDGSFFPSN